MSVDSNQTPSSCPAGKYDAETQLMSDIMVDKYVKLPFNCPFRYFLIRLSWRRAAQTVFYLLVWQFLSLCQFILEDFGAD